MKKLDPRSVIIGLLLGIISVMSIGATSTTFDTITVGDIRMKNSELNIINRKGIRAVNIDPYSEGTFVSIYKKNGKPDVVLGSCGNGSGTAVFYNSRQKEIVSIGGCEVNKQEGSVILNKPDGSIGWFATASISNY